ncbi:MAG: antibiotic biosynthesis monooxygenase [Anaerolineae bacterium]|nr:antibiotic biosynthesis monooxygenase [Anaerolineae bacterium]
MIERQVTFRVLPEQGPRFEALFRDEYAPTMATMPGFVSVSLLHRQDDASLYQMAIRFASVAAADAWRASGQHKALSPKLKALYSESTVQVHDLVHEVRS